MRGVPFLERIVLADFLAGHFAAARKGQLKDDAVSEMTVGDRMGVQFGDDPRPAAHVSLPRPATYAKVKNPAAFLRWVKANLPGEVETIEQVREGTKKALLDQAKARDGKWVSPDGELVAIDGIEITTGDPSPRVELTGDAAEVIGKAWRAGLIDLAEMIALPAPDAAPGADEETPAYPGGLFTDEDGRFYDPPCAAAHAIVVQGGVTTPVREAARMIRDGGVSEQRARAWMAREGITEDDLKGAA